MMQARRVHHRKSSGSGKERARLWFLGSDGAWSAEGRRRREKKRAGSLRKRRDGESNVGVCDLITAEDEPRTTSEQSSSGFEKTVA